MPEIVQNVDVNALFFTIVAVIGFVRKIHRTNDIDGVGFFVFDRKVKLFRIAGSCAYRTGHFTSATIFDHKISFPIFIDFSDGHLILLVGFYLLKTNRAAISTTTKSLHRASFLAIPLAGFTGREPFERPSRLPISLQQDGTKPDSRSPLRVHQKITATYDTDSRLNRRVFQEQSSLFHVIRQGVSVYVVLLSQPLLQRFRYFSEAPVAPGITAFPPVETRVCFQMMEAQNQNRSGLFRPINTLTFTQPGGAAGIFSGIAMGRAFQNVSQGCYASSDAIIRFGLRNDLRGLDLHGRYPNLLLIDNSIRLRFFLRSEFQISKE